MRGLGKTEKDLIRNTLLYIKYMHFQLRHSQARAQRENTSSGSSGRKGKKNSCCVICTMVTDDTVQNSSDGYPNGSCIRGVVVDQGVCLLVVNLEEFGVEAVENLFDGGFLLLNEKSAILVAAKIRVAASK